MPNPIHTLVASSGRLEEGENIVSSDSSGEYRAGTRPEEVDAAAVVGERRVLRTVFAP